MDQAERVARTRYFTIAAVRLAGAVTIALAVAVVMGKIAAVPHIAGYGLLLLGVAEMVLLPQFLVSKWKSPPAA